MAFREVRVFEVREVLRLWLGDHGFRTVERLSGIDPEDRAPLRDGGGGGWSGPRRGRGTAHRRVPGRGGEKVRPHRLDGHGEAWRLLEQHGEQIKVWLDDEDLTVAKVRDLLGRQGIVVPARTLERFAAQLCGPRRGRKTTFRVADGEPGDELQVDFGRMGLLFDTVTGRRRVCHALIFTACCSRHCFVG